jgi:glycosyltransferase involved in cell wall biosynthesis
MPLESGLDTSSAGSRDDHHAPLSDKNEGRTKMPRVSVITGYYNRSDVVDRTLSSVLSQTYSDLELVVFDDASSDGTAASIQRFADKAQDSRLTVRNHEANLGFVRGLAEAIADTDSEFIAIQGSGDVSHASRLERQVELLDARPEVGAVGCWYYNIVEHEGIRRLRKPDADAADLSSLMERNVFSHGEVMIRRSAYDAAGGYRLAFSNSQDVDLWLRLVQVAQLATVKEPLYERYVQFDGVSYHPRKLAKQARYSIAARQLVSMSMGEADYWLQRIEAEGPGALVPDDHPILQRRYMHSAIRSAIWGATDDAVEIASSIQSAAKRRLVVAAVRAAATPIAKPMLALARKALGVSS